MTLKIIGAGFGRTGTLSLKFALEKLGLGSCYHMMEVYHNPAHIELWSRATKGEAIDWKALLENYTACVDWPACYFWDLLRDVYPDAKVLLSVRDAQSWYESVRNTIYISMRDAPEDDSVQGAQLRMARQLILEQQFDGRFEDQDYAIDVFNEHIRTVQNSVPADRLLTFDAREGWSSLCQFLDVPVPDEPYPKVNTTEQFRERLNARSKSQSKN